MSKSLDTLAPEFRPLAEELLAAVKVAGIDIVIICTTRTHEEQKKALAAGTSWTVASKHLTGHAIDIAPRELLSHKNWDPANPLWWQLGRIGRGLGLRWGGDWKDVGVSEVGIARKQWDPGHFEMRAHKENT